MCRSTNVPAGWRNGGLACRDRQGRAGSCRAYRGTAAGWQRRVQEDGMASEKVKTFTDNNFDNETSTGVVLVDFWAEWCGPCRRLAPTVDALAADYDGRATVAKMNVDENPNVPGRFAVRGIPTLLLFKEGQLAETIVGLRAKEDIAQMIERHLGD